MVSGTLDLNGSGSQQGEVNFWLSSNSMLLSCMGEAKQRVLTPGPPHELDTDGQTSCVVARWKADAR